jgi:hypothetical protein
MEEAKQKIKVVALTNSQTIMPRSVETVSDAQELISPSDNAPTPTSETTSPQLTSTSISHSQLDASNSFVIASNGTDVFGQVSLEQAKAMNTNIAAPIKLPQGNEEYGRTHIVERESQLKQNGYNSVEEFVEDVSKSYDEVRTGNLYTDSAGSQKKTFLLVKRGEKGSVLYVELSPDSDFYSINSGGVFKNSYINKRGLLWNASTEHSTPSAVT